MNNKNILSLIPNCKISPNGNYYFKKVFLNIFKFLSEILRVHNRKLL